MALGGFLGGLANLGAVTRGYEAQQAQEQQLQLAALRQKIAQDALAEEQRQRQIQQQSASAAFGLLNDPNSPLSGLANIGGGQPNYAPGAIQGAPLGPPGGATGQPPIMGVTPGMSYPGPNAPQPINPQLDLARAAVARGYPLAAAAGMAGSLTGESGQNLDPYALNPTSGATGMAQWLGPRRAGLMRMPQPFSRGTQQSYFFNELAGPERATGQRMMTETEPRQAARDFTTGFERPGNVDTTARENAAQAVFQQLDGAQRQRAQDAAISTATAVPPAYSGRLNLPQLAQMIKRNNPGISDEAGMGALMMLHNLLAPDAKVAFQQQLEAYKFGVTEADKRRNEERQEARDAELAEYHRGLLTRGAAGGAESLRVGKNYEITNTNTGAVRTVFGREEKGRAGIVDAMTGEPIQFDPKTETIKEVTASTAGGGRAGAQLQRQTTAGAEVTVDLQNVADMPVGATTGIFGSQGIERGLIGALKTDLGTHLTKEDETNMIQAMAGLGRELSTLMSPVYNGNWASDQLQPLIPREGYTVFNSLYGIARIKQSAINALQSLQPSPIVGAQQKEYARKLENDINEAIPWSVRDVIAFQRQQNPQETFGEFAKQSGVSGASSRQAPRQQQYKVGDIFTGKDGKQYRITSMTKDGKPDNVEPVAGATIPPR